MEHAGGGARACGRGRAGGEAASAVAEAAGRGAWADVEVALLALIKG